MSTCDERHRYGSLGTDPVAVLARSQVASLGLGGNTDLAAVLPGGSDRGEGVVGG